VSGLSNAIGTVGAQTGQWFAAHPDANKAVTAAGEGGDAEGAIRNYFVAHPSEWAELQRIAQPLRSLRQQCGSNVAPADIARLYDAMAS
jgi:hemophore-related protein